MKAVSAGQSLPRRRAGAAVEAAEAAHLTFQPGRRRRKYCIRDVTDFQSEESDTVGL